MLIRKQLLQKLQEINGVIDKNYTQEENIGSLSGVAGIALFQFYYSRLLNDDLLAEQALDKLSYSINKINDGYSLMTYCTGIAGLGWVMNHLVQENFLEEEYANYLSDLDDVLYTRMVTDFEDENFDYLHGGIGYGFYFFKLYKNTHSPFSKKKYKKYLLELLTHLNKIAEKENDFYKWRVTLDYDLDQEGYNMGLAHGLPSIISFLARLYVYEDFKKTVKPLLDGALRFLLAIQNTNKHTLACFPASITIDTAQETDCRLAWCYGDTGIGMTLWSVSHALKNDALTTTAMQVLRQAARRKTKEESGVVDASICHGSFGNALIFNKMHYWTGEAIFKESANFWIADGLSKAIHENGFAGYKQYVPMDGGWHPRLSLLDGIAGIGLTIIDYLSEEVNNWDECLMIS